MPGFDGTGPARMGSLTGGGRGLCNSSRTAYGPTPILRPGIPFGRFFNPRYGSSVEHIFEENTSEAHAPWVCF